MRTIGIFIIALILIPSLQLQKTTENENNIPGTFRFHIPLTTDLTSGTRVKTTDIDTNKLKQSSWYTDAIKNIEESEYEIKPVDKLNEFASPNRQQNLRAFYTADKFTLGPRSGDNWNLELTLKGVYAGKKKIYSSQKDAIAVIEKNKIQFNHNNEFTVEYINSKEGVRQNFIINKQPAGNPSTLNIKLSTNSNWFINKVHPKEIHFAKYNAGQLEKKLTYNDLKVWDATNKELDASFSVVKNEVSINVNTEKAVYPVTIDPLSTSPNTTLNGAASGDYFAISVASAGDVNGDGYSDVVVGADRVASSKGAAYIYMGSATGISTIPDKTLNGLSANDYFGHSVASAGDVNGDGYSDVIVGAYGVSSGIGAAYLFLGSGTGLSTAPATTLTGLVVGDFGWSVASAGDVNGDGKSDVIIGAWDVGSFFGAAYLYLGNSTGVNSVATTILTGTFNEDRFGWSVASAGDVNGDGYSDVIIGLWGTGPSSSQGKADVFLSNGTGLSTSPIVLGGLAGGDEFGYSVSSAGDVNGDGYSDVIVGAPGVSSGKGAAYLYLGSNSGTSTTISVTLNGINTSDQFGYSVACAGDINGDGYSDVIAGAPVVAPSSTGATYLFLGSSSGISSSPSQTLNGITSSSSFGYTIASAGDINGDGYSDIIVGAPNASTNTGAAYTYHGISNGLNASATWTVESNQFGAEFGISVSCAGDVNADGYSDVIVGAYLYDDGQPDEGAAFIYHGSSSGLNTTAAITLQRDQAGAYLGYSVSSAGDVNGDGYSDVIVGAYLYDDGQPDEGAAFIYHGSASGISTTPAAILERDQASANMGVSVSAAGDVNGDGYGDVIVGAWLFDDGNTNEGAAFIYQGSASGINTVVAATLECNQDTAFMGFSVSSAGDVNGDGFNDVIVGAFLYDNPQADEGVAFIYHGSALGINTAAAAVLEANQPTAYFGYSVASAGDVNGDGYGDVIVGAKAYDDGDTDEGAAFVFHGSPAGINTTIAATLEDNQGFSFMGISVASAGDVNGDGYSDVISGAFQYDNGQPDEGGAFIYLGSSSGINTTVSSILESNQSAANLGVAVASAGDVNGDGYSDVIVGAWEYNSEGAGLVYHGNNTGNNLRNNLRLYNSDLITPIQQSNMGDPNLFGVGLFAKSFLGRQKGRLVWETVKNGQPFTGTPITNSTLYTSQTAIDSVIDLTGKELKHQISKQTPAKATYIRARLKYDKVTSITGQVYGPWRYPEGFLRGRRDIGAVILPVKFISFTAVKQDQSALLKWITVDEEPGVQFEVQHSADGINFSTLVSINGRNQTQNEYQWLHINPSKGNNFYRIRAVENQKQAYTATRKLNFSEAAGIRIYPNPSVAGQALHVESIFIKQNQPLRISFVNNTGQIVWQKEITAVADGKIVLNIPEIPAGAYYLLVQAGPWKGKEKIVIVDP